MAILPTPVVDYSDKDFDSLRARLYNLISSVFPDWTDQNVANFGNILVELNAFIGDVLGFYLDNHALESRIVTATQRRSLIALSKLIGYTPAGASASQVDAVFTIPATVAGDVVIPAGTVVRTQSVSDPVRFQVLADATITAGSLEVAATIENSQSFQEVFAATGLAFQEVEPAQTPFLDGSATITDASGAYTVVDDFLSSQPADRHVTITVDQNDRATLRFGNGVNGQVPTGNITVSYKTGGGTAGNVDANTLTQLTQSFSDTFGTPVQLSVTNPGGSSGGTERETKEQIRLNAPASLRTLNRSVTREDYQTNALRIAGVARAILITVNERAGVPINTGLLYVVPDGGGTPSTALKADVLNEVTVNFPGPLTFNVTVEDPEYLTVDVTATVHIRSGSNAATVAAAIRSNLTSFFAVSNADGTPNTNIDFGSELGEAIAFSDVYNVVRDTTGVRKIDDDQAAFFLNGAASDVALAAQQFPVLGAVSVIDAATQTAI